MRQVLLLVLAQIESADALWELLLETRAELKGIGCPKFHSIRVVAEKQRGIKERVDLVYLQKRRGRGISDLSCAKVYSDHTLVVGVEDKLNHLLIAIIRSSGELNGVRPDASMVLQSDAFLHSTLSS